MDKHRKNNFECVDSRDGLVGMVKNHFIGNSADECIKLYLYLTDPFIRPPLLSDNIRLVMLKRRHYSNEDRCCEQWITKKGLLVFTRVVTMDLITVLCIDLKTYFVGCS